MSAAARAALLGAVLGLAACAGTISRGAAVPSPADPFARARAQGYTVTEIGSAVGPIRMAWRGAVTTAPVHVYIEGDGKAWLTSTRPSPDPTPRKPVALLLALADPAPAVLYLARPCQYASTHARATCDLRYWTTHRYAAELVDVYTHVLDDWLAAHADGARLGFVGYSGGAVIAALLASRRDDSDWLVSVAGNLDVAAWTRHHGVSSLSASLDPRTDAARLHRVPQALLLGGRDRIVPPVLLDAYRGEMAAVAATRVFADFDHGCCWETVWPAAACAVLAATPAAGGLCGTGRTAARAVTLP